MQLVSKFCCDTSCTRKINMSHVVFVAASDAHSTVEYVLLFAMQQQIFYVLSRQCYTKQCNTRWCYTKPFQDGNIGIRMKVSSNLTHNINPSAVHHRFHWDVTGTESQCCWQICCRLRYMYMHITSAEYENLV